MAEITKTNISGSKPVVVAVTVLGASDTIAYSKGKGSTLILNNVTAGVLTPTITGSTATTYPAVGLGDVVTSGGFVFPVAIQAGETRAIDLDAISGWLKGVVTVTGADAIEAQLTEG